MIPKFRAWWIQDEVMTHIDTLEFLQGGIRVSDGCWHEKFLGDEVILMQSTGLKDKNGVEIFEGDIIKTKTGILQSVEYIRASVTKDWSETVAAFKCRQGDEYFYFDLATDEVIGNIYEDKELLEVE